MDGVPIRILLAEDNPADVQMVQEMLAGATSPSFRITTVPKLDLALERLAGEHFDLFLLDPGLPSDQWLSAFERAHEIAPHVPIIVLTGPGDCALAEKAVGQGAQDYLVKGEFDARLLMRSIGYAIERQRLGLDLKFHLQEAALLRTVANLFGSDAELTEVLLGVCAALAGFLQVSQVWIAILNPEKKAATVVADFHPPDIPGAIGAVIPVAGNPSMTHILECGTPLSISDAQADPRLSPVQETVRRHEVCSFLIVPVVTDGEVVGTLGLDSFQRREFSPKDIEFVLNLANQSGQLLRRKQVEKETQCRAAELEAFLETVLEINAQHHLPILLHTIVERAARLLDAPGGGLFLCDPERREVRCVSSYGTQQDHGGTVLPYGEGAVGTVALTGEPVMVDDYRTWSHRAAAFEADQTFRAALAVPMLWQGQVIGVIRLTHLAPDRHFTATDRNLLSRFANHAAIAVENARLHGQAEREITERTQALAELRKANRGLRIRSECYRVLSRVADESRLLHEFCQVAVKEGGYRLAWVGYAQSDSEKSVRPVAKAGFEDGYLERARFTWSDDPLGRGPAGTAIRTGEPAVVTDLLADPVYAPWREEATTRGYGSCIAFPLLVEGRQIGALTIYAAEPGAFDGEHVHQLAEMSDNLAYGIAALRARAERRRTEEALGLHAERLRALHEIDQAIQQARSPEDVAQSVLGRIRYLLPCHRASVTVFDFEAGRAQVLATHVDGETLLGAGVSFPIEHFGVSDELTRGRVHIVDDILYDPDSKRETSLDWALLAEDVRATANIPLLAGGELLGTLNLGAANSGVFTSDRLAIVDKVARPLAIAIQQARLREQLQHHTDSLEETVAQRTRELKAERDRTHAILEALGEAVIVTDVRGTILYTNPATTVLTGYRQDELIGQTQRIWQGDSQSAELYSSIETSLRRGEIKGGETVHRRKDGTLYDAVITAAPVFDPDEPEQLVGSVCVQRDITPLKEAERMKEQFVSNVSHELRTPLSIITLISGNLDNMYQRLDDTRRQEMIRAIREYVWLLNDLIGDVLEISRIDSGRISQERQRLDLVGLVASELDKAGPQAGRKRQNLSLTGAGSLAVVGNEGQLRLVVQNLLDNAMKFTPEGGQITCACTVQDGEVDLGMRWPGCSGLPPGRWAALTIRDSGVGIGEDELPLLFQRFYRVKTQGNIPGTGLGLVITRELVELHDGHIAMSSSLGDGSAFAIFLPLWEE